MPRFPHRAGKGVRRKPLGLHYNLQDAARLTGLPTFTFAHCDAEALAQALRKNVTAGQRPVVLTDGVFATSGRVPPLADYVAVLESYGGQLFVDESHASGVVGESGIGAAEYCGVLGRVATGATLVRPSAPRARSWVARRNGQPITRSAAHRRCMRRFSAVCGSRSCQFGLC